MSEHHANARECELAAKDQLHTALAGSKKWLSAVVTIDEKGGMHIARTTCDFPLGRAEDAVRMLHSELVKEALIDTSPLPVATGFGKSVAEAMGEAKGGITHAAVP